MVLEKKVYYVRLYDIYSKLLTIKQQQVFEYYFLDDISLNEISSIVKTTKQAVKFSLDKTIKLLEKYENALNVYEKLEKQSNIISKDKVLSEKINKLWWED